MKKDMNILAAMSAMNMVTMKDYGWVNGSLDNYRENGLGSSGTTDGSGLTGLFWVFGYKDKYVVQFKMSVFARAIKYRYLDPETKIFGEWLNIVG